MSTVRYYRWDDSGAPQLSGQVGALTNILRKCLVGAGGVAYGAKSSAGWSEEFIGAAANIAAFRNNEGEGGSGCYVLIDDNAPGAGGAREARMTVYAAMTDIDTGLSATESPWIRKSTTADSTTRRWLVIADELSAWVYTYCVDGASLEGYGRDATLAGFGDYACIAPSSAYRYFAMGRPQENWARSGPAVFNASTPAMDDEGLSAVALDGLSGSMWLRMAHPAYYSAALHGIGGTGAPEGPNPITGDLYFQKNPVVHTSEGILGRLRGLTLPYQSIIDNTEATELPGYSGQIVVKTRAGYDNSNNSMGACVLLDSIGPWP